MNRRSFVKMGISLLAYSQLLSKNVFAALATTQSNFKKIYRDKALKGEFYKFLQNVFNLYPEDKLHNLIDSAAMSFENDEEIYKTAQAQVDEITPAFSVFKYQLPALFKQKDEMAKQTLQLLGKGSSFNGYLEIGSSGRYLDYLEERVSIKGRRFYADGKKPGHAITEMIDRGQICIGADYIPLADYSTKYSELIENNSLDLVTNYIGFHHCPLDLRNSFISSIRDTLRVGGQMILRDHNCISEDQKTLVALAHDVFNMGTHESWEYNHTESRHFYSLDFIIQFVESIGFEYKGKSLYQEGDPTQNALMVFVKV